MREKIRNYYKINIQPAIKNARANSKKNITFVLAILVMQFLLCTSAMAVTQNNKLEREEVSRDFNYHLAIRDLNKKQRNKIIESVRLFSIGAGSGDYKYVGEKSIYDGKSNTYDVFVKFEGSDLRAVYYSFIQNFTEELKREDTRAIEDEELNFTIKYDLSPLFYADAEYDFGTFGYFLKTHIGNFFAKDYAVDIFGHRAPRVDLPPFGIDGNTISSNTFIFFVFNTLIVLFSTFLLMSLYSERINHYKFDFGIYSVYGADTKKLIRMSVWEILVCDILLLIPAAILSILTLSVIYRSFVFYPLSILKYGVLSVVIVYLAVYFPVRALRSQSPVTRLMASDNSNYVTSPRQSLEVFRKKYPTRTSLIGLWRFRKYYARVMLICAAFSSLFILGIYSASLYDTHLVSDSPQFIININDRVYDYSEYKNEIRDPLLSLDGVKDIKNELSVDAKTLVSHVLVPKKAVTITGNMFIGTKKTGGNYATDFVKYISSNEEILGNLKNYSYDGTLKIDSDSVVITNSINGEKLLNIKPGDKIKIARLINIDKTVAGIAGINLLGEQIETFTYDYKEYTVSAVVTDYSLKDNFAVYIDGDEFTHLNRTLPAMAVSSFVSFQEAKLIEETADLTRLYRSGFQPIFYSTTDFSYSLLDSDTVAYLKSLKHKGDIEQALSGKNKIVIFKSKFLSRNFTFDVGDELIISKSELSESLPKGLKDKELIERIMKYSSKRDEEAYTIAAIIEEDIGDEFGIFGSCIFFSPAEYEEVADRKLTYSKAEVYIDEDLKFTEIEGLWYKIRESIERGNLSAGVVNTNAKRTKELLTNSNYYALIVTISTVMLIAGMIICMFSQRLFYLRREKEVFILRSLGAIQKEIKKTHIFEGLLLSIGTAIFYLIFGYVGCFLIHRIANASSDIIILFRIPIIPYLIGLVVIVATGIISALLPYYSYLKKGGGVNGNT